MIDKKYAPLFYNNISVSIVYQNLNIENSVDITHFWLTSGAINDIKIIKSRIKDVVLVAKNTKGIVIGISSVYLNPFLNSPNQYYFYRMFIHPMHHQMRLMTFMTMQTWLHLKEQHKDKAQGMIIVTENKKLMKKGFVKYFKKILGFQYFGKNEYQQDIWILDFNQDSNYFK